MRHWILSIMFRRLDLQVRRDELFLDPELTLTGMARLSGINRTYVSGAVRTRFVCFRDYLRSHRDVAMEYAELKKDLAARFPYDIDGYCDGKDAFVKRIENLALAEYSK